MATRHHVVSQGYLRHFADGKRVRLIDKYTDMRSPPIVGVRDAFVERGFNALNIDGADVEELEKEWARLEARALPDVRRLLEGERDAASEYGVRVVIALHWARSFVFRDTYEKAFDGRFRDFPDEMASSPEVTAAFVEEFGREPSAGEIEELVREKVNDRERSNALFVELLASNFNKAMDERFSTLHVEITRVASRAYGLVTSDSPVVLIRDPLKVDLRAQVPLLQADGIFMPLSRSVAACLTSKPEPDKDAFPHVVQQLNALTWRNARRQVACHPAENWRRAVPVAPRGNERGGS